jgi:hypothetical protein
LASVERLHYIRGRRWLKCFEGFVERGGAPASWNADICASSSAFVRSLLAAMSTAMQLVFVVMAASIRRRFRPYPSCTRLPSLMRRHGCCGAPRLYDGSGGWPEFNLDRYRWSSTMSGSGCVAAASRMRRAANSEAYSKREFVGWGK